MPINAHPDYLAAENEYLQARTIEDKVEKLKKMISLAPSHKGAEKLRAQLKTRLKKLREDLIKSRKAGKSSKKGIKKEDMQAIIIGKTNSGKSSLLKILTNTYPKISENKFTTQEPELGMMNYKDIQIQIIENPAIESENYNKGLTNSADTILILITSLEELKEIENILQRKDDDKYSDFNDDFTQSNRSGRSGAGRRDFSFYQKTIIAFNKADLFSNEEKRKISANLQSRKYSFILISTITQEGIEELKEKIFNSFDKIRIFTKEPGKEKSQRPIIMKPGATAKNIAEKILKGFSEKVKETRIWGPSSKFPGQIVGLSHELKDMDVVEFKTK
jgi:ribosome-interacting GTPase 1